MDERLTLNPPSRTTVLRLDEDPPKQSAAKGERSGLVIKGQRAEFLTSSASWLAEVPKYGMGCGVLEHGVKVKRKWWKTLNIICH